jgi:TetR/AcrR family transcriptional regulator, transcriptional repressor for nem operon
VPNLDSEGNPMMWLTGTTMSSKRDTRTEVLELAEKLFHERGFRGFSYADIAGPLGIKPAAIHYHFQGKEELGVALIERIRDRLKAAQIRFVAEQTPWDQQLEFLFAYYRRHAEENCGVCAVGVSAIEADSIPHSMQIQVRLLIKEVLNALVQILARGRDAGLFHFEGRAEERATLMLAALGGALQLQRLTGLPQLETVIAELQQALITSH